MALKDELERSGNFLFRWRSYPPALFFGVVLWGVRGFRNDIYHAWPGGVWEVVCLVPVVVGLGVRLWAIGSAAPKTSGGNRMGQVAESLNTTGAYSLVRHPLYLGVLLGWLGVAMLPRSIGIVVVVGLLFQLYYERIMIAEESYLQKRFGAAYDEWSSRTPALIPRFGDYVPAKYPFSWRRGLLREYSAWISVATPLFVLKVYMDYVRTGELIFERAWVIGFAAVWLAAAIVRFLKHYTSVLRPR
jgi:protein-S-isoprenylcysteine O-methyltransferase Ste14